MEFFDSNCFIGLPTIAMDRPAPTAKSLLAEMDRSGIARALVWHVAQRDVSAQEGNRLLAKEIAPYRDRLGGCWTILPTQTRELPRPDEFFAQMTRANILALRVFPKEHRYLLRREVMGRWLEKIVDTRTPLIYRCGEHDDRSWQVLYDLLKDFPRLVCIISDTGLWGSDRYFRPLIETYADVYLEFSTQIVAGGIADFVKTYGGGRMLFGTGFPTWDHGGMMLALKHANISDADRQSIASGNLDRILAGVQK